MLSDLIPALSLSIFLPLDVWPLDQWAQAAINLAVLGFCSFVLSACLCRLRFGTGTELSVRWALLYLAVAGCAVLMVLQAIDGQARFLDACLAGTTAAYLWSVTDAWRTNVPPVARPKRASTPHTQRPPSPTQETS